MPAAMRVKPFISVTPTPGPRRASPSPSEYMPALKDADSWAQGDDWAEGGPCVQENDDSMKELRAARRKVAQQDRVLKRLHVSHFARAGTPQGIRSPSPRVGGPAASPRTDVLARRVEHAEPLPDVF